VAETVAVRATIVDDRRHREQGAAGSSRQRRVQRVSWEWPHRDSLLDLAGAGKARSENPATQERTLCSRYE
jgi:hypothetical protein